jgi:excisionase family DNA binding protein
VNNGTVEENLLTPAKVAEILQVSKAMAYALLQQGKIPVVRINSLVRVRRADLERYIREQMELGEPKKI